MLVMTFSFCHDRHDSLRSLLLITRTFLASAALVLTCGAGVHCEKVHPPQGFHAYRASMYGNERTRAARRISCRHTASSQPFRANANAFAMNGALGNTYKIWTPGHGVTNAVCNDTGADHPDLAYGLFHRLYYCLPSRHGGRSLRSADSAGVMTIWMKRSGKVSFRHKRGHK